LNEKRNEGVQQSLLRGSIDGKVDVTQVGVAGEGGAGLAVHKETNLGDAREVGVEGSADGEDGEGLGFKAGRVACGEGWGEVDDGQFGAGVV
jgi:hypothetical protein